MFLVVVGFLWLKKNYEDENNGGTGLQNYQGYYQKLIKAMEHKKLP